MEEAEDTEAGRMETTKAPEEFLALLRQVRAARRLKVAETYRRYLIPALEREWAVIISEEAERLRESDPGFANELGENGGA